MKEPIGKPISVKWRYMKLEEFKAIIDYFFTKKDYLYGTLFLTQAGLGLRISEATAINISDFDQDFKSIKVRLAKTDEILIKPVPSALGSILYDYCNNHRYEIKVRDGFLFYSFNGYCKRKHIEKRMAWIKIREACAACGCNDYIFNHKDKKMYRIGTHSIRRLSITQMRKITNDIYKVCKWVGHHSPEETLTYSDPFYDNINKEVEQMFSKFVKPVVDISQLDSVKQMIEEKVKEALKNIFQSVVTNK